MPSPKLFFISFFLVAFVINAACAETIFTHLSKYTKDDTRHGYHIELLELALDRTEKKYGPYRLVPAPVMNAARSIYSIKENKYPNFFVNEQVTAQRLDEFGYVPFPILRGIVGYRVFFVSPQVKDKIKKIESLEQLKKYTIGQGLGWGDIEILKYNGFDVIVGSSYEGLFKMLAENRFNLLARGIGEVLGEYETYKDNIDLILDDSIAIYYPLPRYFFTNKSNKEAIKRVTEGLLAAYEDGSFMKLWNKYHSSSIKRVDLPNRTIFKLENPLLYGVDKSYEKYLYKP